ncbi:MAG: hypothetical protein IPI84_14300 [Holophagaceae bacterium]|nr:hypothetical protein [Holophagaceae bacterium]
MAGLRRVIERIPAGRMDFRPHPKSFSLHDLANHLVTVPGWAATTMAETELDFGLPETRARQPKPSDTVEGLLRTLDAGVEKALGALSSASDEDFQVIWTLKNEGPVPPPRPAPAGLPGLRRDPPLPPRAPARPPSPWPCGPVPSLAPPRRATRLGGLGRPPLRRPIPRSM